MHRTRSRTPNVRCSRLLTQNAGSNSEATANEQKHMDAIRIVMR